MRTAARAGNYDPACAALPKPEVGALGSGAPLTRAKPDLTSARVYRERIAGLYRGVRERALVVGREAEVAVLVDFLMAGLDTPQALVLDGEAGIGKTTLFETAVAEARGQGFVVVACRPAGAEAAFSFAALNDLLGPLLAEGLERVPVPQRRALSAALLLEEVEGSAPDERAIAFAVFQLLGERGGGPLLVAVDDVQWLDAASASVLAFALRRLAAVPAAILVARRGDGEEAAPLGLDRAFPSERLRRLRVGPLSVGATHRLLRERLGVSFPRPTLVRLHETSGGNPFYALELGRVLEHSANGAVDRLTIPRSLGELVSARLAALPVEVREVLEPVALLSEATVTLVEAAASEPVTVLARLRTAEVAAILELDDELVRFSHPLLAARVESELDPRRRRSLHRRLAELVADPEQRARHLALGANAPSAAVADELETASATAASRGAPGAAAELAERSLSLTPADACEPVRRRRQLLAADHHYASGDAKRARVILEALLKQLPAGAERADVLRRLGERSDDDFEKSERLLQQAFVEAEADPRLKAEIVMPRVLTAYLRHGAAAAVMLAWDSAHVVEETGDPVLLALFLAQLSLVELNAQGVTPGVLERALELEKLVGPLPTHTTPTFVEGLRLMYADEHEAARAALRRAHAVGVARGDFPAQTSGLFYLGLLECRAGQWGRAAEYAGELLEAEQQRGHAFEGVSALWIGGLVDAYLGRLVEARARAIEGVSRSHEEGLTGFVERHLAF